LFRQGEAGAECFVILAGELEVLTYVGGAELRLEVYRPGQLIGEMALIDRSPRSATVRALREADLLVLGEAAFKTLLSSNPELAMAMLRSGTARVRNTNQRMIADLERKNAELLAAYTQLQAAQAELIRLSRIDEELAVARRIQESFLPRRLPQPAGWQVAAYSRGAQAVGGDFFDCIELADGRLGLVVADACGKGVTAALFVALTRSLLRAASQAPWIFQGGAARDPESVLTGALWLVNDYICREHGDSNMFITLFYGVLDPATGELAYLNAGHNPPLRVAAGGAPIVETGLGTMPVGILPVQSYEVQRALIGPGERLVAFSDGITEAANPADELFGDERLHAAIAAGAHLGAQDLVEAIVAQVDAFAAGAPQSDDLTLLVAAREAPALSDVL
ncbi:MAG TPA: SpoIIE family protein phosphatase, partial [Chloroflexaceae bacterium]|nr:SpoIIE family protein phosphatase [Chloroflexaceae bacterium]